MGYITEITIYTWLLNCAYAASSVAVATLTLWVFQRFLGGRIKLNTELYKGNVAVAIVIAAVVIGVCMVVSSAHGATGGEYTRKYDGYFRHYGHRFFSRAVDWRWFRAQGIAESSLDPDAVSPMGAQGLMQLMPATGQEMADKLAVVYRPLAARCSVLLGIACDRRVWDIFTRETGVERIRYMLAGYNAGPGHIIRAQALAEADGARPDLWADVGPRLVRVTGRHAGETLGYVHMVQLHYARMYRHRGSVRRDR